jgi:hypothetical protein
MALLHADTPGDWQSLFGDAMRLIDDVKKRTGQSDFWTLGGGTVLMLRHRHRLSKDIDIFVPDPQYLGYFNPEKGGLAEELAGEHLDGGFYIKLYLSKGNVPTGEIDFVVSQSLTNAPYIVEPLMGRDVKVESDAEIVAKKMWHRGNEAKARDLFDLSLVIERSEGELRKASEFLIRHREAFLRQLGDREEVLRTQFREIAVLDYRPSFDACAERVREFLTGL